MIYTYKDHVDPYCKDAHIVTIPASKIAKVRDFLVRFKAAKMKEDIHQEDWVARDKRFYTGHLGEAGLEVLFDIDFMDTSVGESRKYAVPDLLPIGLDCGIKTVTREPSYSGDSFPAVERNPKRPEIINFKLSDDTIMICGLATVSVLNNNSTGDLIRDRRMSLRKTGFYGFDKLLKFKNLQELRALLGK